VEQRACLIRCGLKDRKPAVREAAQQLLRHWLDEDMGGSVPRLLERLDVYANEEVACGAASPCFPILENETKVLAVENAITGAF
jgi:hypothetical protein